MRKAETTEPASVETPEIREVEINPTLNKYDNVVLFPEKLVKANAQLKKSGAPKLPELKR